MTILLTLILLKVETVPPDTFWGQKSEEHIQRHTYPIQYGRSVKDIHEYLNQYPEVRAILTNRLEVLWQRLGELKNKGWF